MDRTTFDTGLESALKVAIGSNKDAGTTIRDYRVVYLGVRNLLLADAVLDYSKGSLNSTLKEGAAKRFGLTANSADGALYPGWFLVTAVAKIETAEDPDSMDGTTLKIIVTLRDGSVLRGGALKAFIAEVNKIFAKKTPVAVKQDIIAKAGGTLAEAVKMYNIATLAADLEAAKADQRPVKVAEATAALKDLEESFLSLDDTTLAPLLEQLQRVNALMQAQSSEAAAVAKAEKVLA